MFNAKIFGLGIGIGTFAIIALILAILTIIAYWKMFEKANKPGWHSIIPFLNIYDVFDICWKGIYGIVFCAVYFIANLGEYFTGYDSVSGTFENSSTIWITIMIISVIATIILELMCMHKLSKAFGHGIGFTLGLIFLSPIFMLILGFGNSQYIGKEQINRKIQ